MALQGVKGWIKKRVPKNLIDEVQISLGKKIRVLDLVSINKKQETIYGSCEVIAPQNFLSKIHKSFFEGESPNRFIPDKTIGAAQSWAPYSFGQSSVLLYNFFERNYGIKDPILYRFVVVDEAGRIAAVESKVLGPNGIYFGPPSNKPSELPRQGSIVIQAFHPKIRTLDGQLRYFAFLGKDGQDINCGVHSLTIRPVNKYSTLGFRNVGDRDGMFAYGLVQPQVTLQPKMAKSEGLLTNLTTDQLFKSDVYFVARDISGVPTSIWHDQSSSHVRPLASPARKMGACKTSFFIPDFENFAPIFSVSADSVGFPVQQLTIHAYAQNGQATQSRHIKVEKDNSEVDIQKIFSDSTLKGPVFIIVDFHRDYGEFIGLPACYLQIYYRGGMKWGDQVHSHDTVGYFNAPVRAKLGFRCRKFAPLIKSPDLDFFYSVVNVGGTKPNKDEFVFIRVMTDTGAERRIRLTVPIDGASFITGKELLDLVNLDIETAGVVHLEHLSTNFNGSWYFINKKRNTLGTDHFTGA